MLNINLKLGAIGGLLLTGLTMSAPSQIITQDKLHSYVGVLGGAAVFTPAATRPNGKPTDYAIDFTLSGGTVRVTNATFLNIASSNDVMTFAFWAKKYDISAGSAFYVLSPSSSGGQRAFQSHLPWSNNRIYFDTAGCCDGGVTRIDEDIAVFANYTGDTSWWTNWHHFVFSKNASAKQIWIDGLLFFEGVGTAPLPTDITEILLGTTFDGNLMHGQIDDLAVYATALVEADIVKLYAGTAPDALGAGSQILAYWGFNDPPVIGNPVGSPVGFTIQGFDVGSSVLDTNTIALTLNSASVTPTSVKKDGVVTTIAYLLPNPPFASGSTNLTTLSIKDQSNATFASSGSFVVAKFGVLTPTMALAPASIDKSKKGFKIRTVQVDNPAVGNGVQVAEDILAGVYGPNVANPDDPNVGSVDSKGYFTWTNLINLDVLTPAANGHFNDPDYLDFQFPGIPGNPVTALPTERFACELYTALEFTASGLYTMVVNSDDCFATYTGPNPRDLFSALNLGSFDAAGGRGAADTSFPFFVQQPGLYGFRTIFQQGGGGGNLEWFMINTDGVRVLINDITNAISGYQWIPTVTAAYVKSVLPADKATGADPDNVQAIIVDGSTPVDKATVTLKIDDSTVAASVSKVGNETTVNYKASPLFAGLSTHKAKLTFNDGATPVTREWEFTVALYTKDSVGQHFGTLLGLTAYTASGGGRTALQGDYAMDLGSANGNLVYVKHAGEFLNTAATNDEMTFSIWLKRRDISDSSAFWARSPSSGGAQQRGWQAHLPWSNNSLYFDTAGCCGAETRISAELNTTTYPPYTGNTGWWTNWHHFVVSKKADVKQIWVEGVLFTEGAGASPLPLDFTDLLIGAESFTANTSRGWVDDFAVYATALGPEDVAKLAGGSAPDSLAASTKLMAYWSFNDAPAGPSKPTISITMANGILSITYTGKLQSSATANGTYAEVSGATSPYTVNTSTDSQKFFRSVQ